MSKLLDGLSRELLPTSWSLLHIAAYQNDPETITSNATADVNGVDRSNRTPLQIALESGHVDCIKALIDKGAELDRVSVNGVTAVELFLQHHCYFGLGLELLEHLEQFEAFLRVALLHALNTSNASLVQSILAHKGAEIVDSFDEIGLTPLHYAAISGNKECMMLILAHTNAVSISSRKDSTIPLHHACLRGHTHLITPLLNASTNAAQDLLSQDINGCTPIHSALYSRHWGVASLLVSTCRSAVVDTRVVDNNGHSIAGLLFHLRCLHRLIPDALSLTIPCLTQEEADWLLHNGISSMFHNNNNNTNKHKGEEGGLSDDVLLSLVLHALSQGADPNVLDHGSHSPLVLGVGAGSGDVCRVLVAHGARPALRDGSGRTALHHAARRDLGNLVDVFLRASSTDLLCVRTVYGRTALSEALYNRSTNVVRELLDAYRECQQLECQSREDWRQLLAYAASWSNRTMLNDIIQLFCPHDWTSELFVKQSPPTSDAPSFHDDGKSRKYLKWYSPSPPPSLPVSKTRRDVKYRRKRIREAQKRHVEFLNEKGPPEFVSLIKRSSRAKSSKMFKQAKVDTNFYPLHQALRGGNFDGFLFLIGECLSHSAQDKTLAKVLASQDDMGTSVATLLAQKMSEERSFKVSVSLEKALEKCLRKEYLGALPEGMSLEWALIYHIITGTSLALKERVIDYFIFCSISVAKEDCQRYRGLVTSQWMVS